MRGVLFVNQIEGFRDAIVYNGVYEIANAPIKPCSAEWKTSPDELDYQMGFGGKTLIEPTDGESGPVLPAYRSINQIPKYGDPDERFDLVGIVLFVEENSRKVTTRRDRETSVREIVVTDHSCSQYVNVSVWSDLAETAGNLLAESVKKLGFVGFTALRATTYKGFSLTATMSTSIIPDPEGDVSAALAQWSDMHRPHLILMREKIIAARDPTKDAAIVTIQTLKEKTAQDTIQEEKHRLRVIFTDVDFDRLNAYLSCSKCAGSCDIPATQIFNCEKCLNPDCVSTPRVTFNCDVTDGTGTLAITIDCEKIFKLTAPDLFKLRKCGDARSMEAMERSLKSNPILIEVGPKATLTTNNVLQWTLKKVIPEEMPTAATDNIAAPPLALEDTVSKGGSKEDTMSLGAGDKLLEPDPVAAEVGAKATLTIRTVVHKKRQKVISQKKTSKAGSKSKQVSPDVPVNDPAHELQVGSCEDIYRGEAVSVPATDKTMEPESDFLAFQHGTVPADSLSHEWVQEVYPKQSSTAGKEMPHKVPVDDPLAVLAAEVCDSGISEI